jgi:tripartite-type tricarboxylate transporter receptor subunit TctC
MVDGRSVKPILKDEGFLANMKRIGWASFYQNSSEAREYVEKEMEEAAKLWGK